MSEAAYRELVRVFEKAVQAGADSIGLEWEDRDLLVVYLYFGDAGLGVVPIPRDLQKPVCEELVKGAKLTREPRGTMSVTLHGSEYEVVVEEYDNFGESAFKLRWKKATNGK